MILPCFLGEHPIVRAPVFTSIYVLLGISLVPFAFYERRHRVSWILPFVLSAMIAVLAIREHYALRSDAYWMILFLALLSLICALFAVVMGIRASKRVPLPPAPK
jgi:hypothetical protein